MLIVMLAALRSRREFNTRAQSLPRLFTKLLNSYVFYGNSFGAGLSTPDRTIQYLVGSGLPNRILIVADS